MAGSSIVAGRYRIESPPIGEGGMGVVYKAFDNVTKRFVAVKTIKGATDHDSIEMFHKEWGVLARLCHPNIIDILDIGEFVENQWKQPYFVMPLLPGTTLDKLIKTSSQRLTPERTVEIICQACRGLQAAHDQGVVHRDIKPSNLFVMDDDTVKIIDFGVVHLADAETRTGVKGTLQYMAPEQLDLKPATARSDIWSLGVVCYEALTRRKPFDGKNAEELIEAIRSRMPLSISDLNPAVNVQISQTVQRALAKEPYHRFSSVRDFSELLQRSARNERIEVFDRSKILPRITRVKKALNDSDYQFAMEIIHELESEGNIDPEISLLRIQAEQAARAKTIEQLLESARTRMEEEEYPLALQKVQSVLNLEPSNVDALALKNSIESQRSATQIERWHQIARQHTDNKLFSKARQAIDEILKIDRSYEPAKSLLAEISRGEQQLVKLRQEKQELYDSALKSYRNGEMSTAITKLERVIELGKLAPGHPNTEAQYLAFHEQIRSERDELRSAYNEGKKALESRDFAKVLEICRAALSRRPREPLFQALKIEAEDLQRQESSASIARFHTRIEAEADLDRKCALLKDAAKQFPDEQTFQHSYRIVMERRNLVNSIVARARHYESQGQLLEASNQWDVLRSIYGQYPGLEFEIQRLNRKQEELLRREENPGSVEEVDHRVDAGDHGPEQASISADLRESPERTELRRRNQAAALLDEAQRLADAGIRALAIEKLRAARELDRDNPSISSRLAAVLVEHARLVASQDWRAALPFIEEALDLSPGNQGAASVSLLIETLRHQEVSKSARESAAYAAAAKAGAGVALGAPAARSIPSGAAEVQATQAPAWTSSSARSLDGSEQMTRVPARPEFRHDQSGPKLIRGADAAYEDEGGGFSTKKIGIAAAVLLLVTGGLLFTWMLRTNGGVRPYSAAQTPQAAQRLATQPAAGPADASTTTKPGQANAPAAAPANGQALPPTVPNESRPEKTEIPVHFASSPAAAEIVVDGDDSLKCATPCDLPLRNGRHTFTMSAPDYRTAQGIIHVPEEKDRFVLLDDSLETVHIYSDPEKMPISIDGQSKGQTPLVLRLRAGDHKVTSTGSYQGAIDVTKGGMNIFTINAKSAEPAAVPNHGAAISAPPISH
ncbi:MAG TPA: protein kinase [Bryobacteraceae bacterium]|nr:protein kinase [Bryobacteraceae bacterium]